ncbi:DUF3887 domain-containing protein [Gordonia sp. SID5947]|uniref:DUF3887 domain-containing protein n=1 Tax=Gordonia sp. SID5947 TaxID=2690315 RepID=UPI00136C4E79|nr:DUF3887 domain-containing protein [Gordonia sp. SID5947]MYR05005.1 DUF3887 domain-containing protein [Gordonia sp. SID5947]
MGEVHELVLDVERYARSIGSEGDGRPGALAQVHDALQLGRRAEELLSATARRARECGCTWQEIGDVVGVTRQAAFQRFGKPMDPRTGEPMLKTLIPHADVMAADLLTRIRAGEWATVVSRFATSMAAALDESGLADAWASVIALRGEVESTGAPFVRLHGLHTVVDVPIEQEAGAMSIRVAFDTDGRIAGLFFLDPEAASVDR